MSMAIILHVEDDNNWIENVSKLLKGKGDYFLVPARTLEKAKKAYADILLDKQVPELVILDISLAMDDKNDQGGIKFAEELVSWGFTERTSIIILSENVNIQTLVELFRNYRFNVADVFRKGEFKDEINRFLETVKKCTEKTNFKFDWADESSNMG